LETTLETRLFQKPSIYAGYGLAGRLVEPLLLSTTEYAG